MRYRIDIALLVFIFLSTTTTVFGFGQDNIQMHGFASQGYLISSDNKYLGNSKDGSFEYNEIGINFSVLINDDLRFGTQFFSRDLGDYGANELSVDWGFLDYTYRDWLGCRAGRIKMPYGLYNRQRDADMLRTSILMPQSVYTEGLRGFVVGFYGFSLYGTKNLDAFGYIDYEVFTGTFDVPANSPFVTESLEKVKYSDPQYYIQLINLGVDVTDISIVITHTEGGMLVWNTPLDGLRLGVTDLIGEVEYELGQASIPANLNGFLVISAEYDIGDVTFTAEHLGIDIETDVDTGGAVSETVKIEGYYGAVSWDIAKWITVGAAYGEYFPNADDKDGSEIVKAPDDPPADYDGPLPDYYAWQKDITASIRLNVNEYWCFKFETHFYDGLGLTSIAQNPPDESEQNWILYLFKTSLTF